MDQPLLFFPAVLSAVKLCTLCLFIFTVWLDFLSLSVFMSESMYVCMFVPSLCVRLSVCVSVCSFVCLCICMSPCLIDCLLVCLPVYSSVCLPVYLCVCLSAYSSVFLFYLLVCLIVCLFVFSSVCVCLLVCLSVWLSACLSLRHSTLTPPGITSLNTCHLCTPQPRRLFLHFKTTFSSLTHTFQSDQPFYSFLCLTFPLRFPSLSTANRASGDPFLGETVTCISFISFSLKQAFFPLLPLILQHLYLLHLNTR